ncbi:hypothetical protein Ancab_024001 [Ancistrocladus abbreviatus]
MTQIVELKAIESEGADPDVPLFNKFRQNKNDTKRQRQLATSSSGDMHENEDSIALVCKTTDLQEDWRLESVLMEPQIVTFAEDSTHVKTFNMVSFSDNGDSRAIISEANHLREEFRLESAHLEPWLQMGPSLITMVVHLTPSSAIGHELEELNWPENNNQAHGSPLADLINLDDEPESSHLMDQLKCHPSPFTKLLNIDMVASSYELSEELKEVSNIKSVTGTGRRRYRTRLGHRSRAAPIRVIMMHLFLTWSPAGSNRWKRVNVKNTVGTLSNSNSIKQEVPGSFHIIRSLVLSSTKESDTP